MSTLFTLFNIAVFIIGIMMISKHKSGGWMSPPVLSGIAFVLISLPDVLYRVGF